jgi:hypothetical protein
MFVRKYPLYITAHINGLKMLSDTGIRLSAKKKTSKTPDSRERRSAFFRVPGMGANTSPNAYKKSKHFGRDTTLTGKYPYRRVFACFAVCLRHSSLSLVADSLYRKSISLFSFKTSRQSES